MDSAPPTKSSFIFEKTVGVDDSIKEYAKMCILLALEEFPYSEDDWKKCELVANKFVLRIKAPCTLALRWRKVVKFLSSISVKFNGSFTNFVSNLLIFFVAALI